MELKAFRQAYRVINKGRVSHCVETFKANIPASSRNSVHRTTSAIQMKNEYYQLCNSAFGVKYQTYDNVIRRSFHASPCLNSNDEDYQRQEKWEANILIGFCISLVLGTATAYSFIDMSEYDKPTIEES